MESWKLGMALCTLACSGTSHAQSVQTWPVKPVQFIVAAVPGGSNEAEIRLYAQKMTENIPGKQFLVDFRPGAGGTIAANYVAKATPDGTILLVVSPNYTISPSVYPDIPYDPIKDLTAITMLSKRPTVLMIHPSVPARTAKEYFSYAKANPGKVNFGTTGAGSSPHLNGAWMHSEAGVQVQFIHYKGTGNMMPDLLSGRIQSTSISFLSSLPQIKAGKTIALGITTSERSPLWPDLPTLAEQGLAGYDYSSWLGIVTAGGTPAPIIARVYTEIAKAGRSPDIAKKLEPDFVQMALTTPDHFQKYIATDIARWRKITKEAGIKAEE
jgi:tripartite-type tricarboxylate transporter receptor subunit TctC